MKILFITRYITDSGVATHMLTLGKEFVNRNHEVAVLSGGAKADVRETTTSLIDDFHQQEIKTYETLFPKRKRNKYIEFFRFIIALPHALYCIRKFKPDIIHVHWPLTSFVAKIYQKLYKIPFIMTFHLANTPNTIFHQPANGVIAISSQLKKEIIENFGYSKDSVYLVYNGVERQSFQRNEDKKQQDKKALGLDENISTITFVGSFEKRKGLDILFNACEKVTEDVPPFQILLAGEGDRNWINELADKHNMTGRVKMFSFQSPQKFYNVADVFVLPSRQEGFGLVVIEAMLMKTPVIRSNTEGAEDQIVHGQDGLLFENENAGDLAAKLKKLLNDKELREKLGKNAELKAEQFFTSSTMAEKTLEAYNDVLKKSKTQS